MNTLIVLLILTSVALARGTYPPGPRSDWFKSLVQPNGVSCCDVSDCKRTQAIQMPDGHWRAIWETDIATTWIDVPESKVLKRPLSIDGEAYLCSTPYVIYCFIPPIPGY